MSALDVLRVAVLVPLCLVFGATVSVLRLYARAWRELPATRVRAITVHVALASMGVLLLTMALAWALLAGFRTGPVGVTAAIRLSMYGIGASCFLVALWVIGSQQRRKVRFQRGAAVVVAEDELVDEQDGGARGG